jgi:type I restriction enzyme S subunit
MPEDIQLQRRIASILGAYDDLIEVNRRRVKLLEEMARGLFDEWFVRFRFPGHETVPLIETEIGPVPKGWPIATLGDFLTLQRGFDLPASLRQEGAIPVISASGFHGSHSESKVTAPGVVTGRSGTIGQVHLVMKDFWPLNTTLYVKDFKKAGPAFAKLLLENLDLKRHAAGAAVPSLNRNHIHCLKLPMPPDELLDRFEKLAMSNMKAADNFVKQSEKLAASRDLLLPRLISGQLSVEAAAPMLAAAE